MRQVLHVNRVGFLGGVERIILTLCSAMEPFGYEPAILCPPGGDLAAEAVARNIRTYPARFDRMRITPNPLTFAQYPFALWSGLQAVQEVAAAQRPQVLHLHHPVGVLYAARAIQRYRIPAILHVHEIGPAKPLYMFALRRAAQIVDRFICVSEPARALAQSAGADSSRVDVINNGIDPSFMRRIDCVPAAEVTGPGPHIGVFGVIEPRKGQDVFIRAAALLAPRFPKARFWIVGSVQLKDKADFRRRLLGLAAELGLENRITFAGHREDVASWMRAMDVVTLPSLAHESFGMVLAEAQVLGRAVVASRIGGTPEVIQDGHSGLLVPPGDVSALADAIERSLHLTPHSLDRVALEARDKYSSEAFCSRVAEVYDRLIDFARPRE